jgi:hypothetical protein
MPTCDNYYAYVQCQTDHQIGAGVNLKSRISPRICGDISY